MLYHTRAGDARVWSYTCQDIHSIGHHAEQKQTVFVASVMTRGCHLVGTGVNLVDFPSATVVVIVQNTAMETRGFPVVCVGWDIATGFTSGVG